MKLEHGVTKDGTFYASPAWTVVGQTYTPQLVCDSAFVWHALIPADTFVPPHIHPNQDEWITVLDGELEVEFGEEKLTAGPGDLVRMPMGEPHGIFNRSGADARSVFGVAPCGKLFDLFKALDGVTDPAELVRLSALHDVHFLPPKDA